MIVYDLNSGQREYPGYDEIEDRRGRGRSRRSDGTYMGYESYPTDYYGDDRYYGDGPQMRRGRGRGRGRSY
jgi:hypothetical protein